MNNFIAYTCNRFYSYAIKYRKSVFALLLLLPFCSFLLFSNTSMSNSSADLLPDSSAYLEKTAEGMDLAPFSRFFYVDIHSKNSEKEQLLQLADLIENKLMSYGLEPLYFYKEIEPESILKFFPHFFSEEAENYLQMLLNEDNISQTLTNSFNSAATFATKDLVPWLRADPLNTRQFLLDKLPHTGRQSKKNIGHYALSEDEEHILLVFAPQFSVHDTEKSAAVYNEILRINAELPEGFSINTNGSLVHTALNTLVIESDIQKIAFFSLLGLSIVFLYFIRSFAGIWLLVAPLFAISISLGIVSLFSASISGIALGFGASVLSIAEDYSVHMHYALRLEHDKRKIFENLSLPLFHGFLLNGTGFCVLLFSSVPAVRQLALFALCSLFIGFLFALFILPLLPSFDKRKNEKNIELQASSINKKEEKSLPIAWRCTVLALLLSSLCVFLFFSLNLDTSPRSMGVKLDKEVANALEFQEVWGSDSGSIIILENVDHVDEEKLFQQARALENAFEEFEILDKSELSSIADFMISAENQEENIMRWNNFIEKRGIEIKNAVFSINKEKNIPSVFFEPFVQNLHTISDKEAQTFDTITLSNDTLTTLFSLFFINDSKKIRTILMTDKKITQADFDKALTSLLDVEIDATLLSPALLESEIRTTFYNEAKYIPLTFLLCALILFLVFRKPIKTLLALLPALFSICIVLSVLYLSNNPLTLGSLIALLIVLGLSLDHGILLSHSIEHSMNLGTHKALFVSSLTTLLGMGLLAFSSHPTLQDMGIVIFIGLLAEIGASFFVLPLVCKKEKIYV